MTQESTPIRAPVGSDAGREPTDAAEPIPDPAPIRFTGRATEYFGIWLANIVLGILTLGIYSAWAKVRRSRYFLGNTIVLGDRLEYHATGMMLLKGRLITVAVLSVYVGIGFVSPMAQIIVGIALVPMYPWIINLALRFNARMTSWRNVRLDWHGEYLGVAKVYLLWPLAAVATLGVLTPMATRAGREYLVNHHALGQERFHAKTPLRPYCLAFLWTLVFGAVVLTVLSVPVVAAFIHFDDEINASLNAHTLPWVGYLASLAPFLAIVSATLYFRILVRNIVLSATTLGHAAGFRCRLSPLRYLWIAFSNIVASVLTAFLLHPWTQIRIYRYQAEGITVRPLVPVTTFLDTERRSGRAVGEEFGEMQDIGIGI